MYLYIYIYLMNNVKLQGLQNLHDTGNYGYLDVHRENRDILIL